MRIAIDTRDLHAARTGHRTYLEEICRAFPQVTNTYEFILLAPHWHLPPGKSALHKILGHLAFYWWKEIELPWRAWRRRCDVIFCTDYVVPLWAQSATVPVFHDAGFWERPQDYNGLWRKLLDFFALPAARRSAAVITVSQSAKARIAHLTHIPPEKLHVVYEGPKQAAIAPPDKTVLEKHKLMQRPFMLHVGVMEKRKNLPRLVEAFALARPHLPPDMCLVLAGQPGPKLDMDDSAQIQAAIQRHNLADQVILTGYVPDDALSTLYQGACFYVFPSVYEGFGLPILEAFANRLPVLAARATALPEVAGDAALYFDPLDIDDIKAKLVSIANDAGLRRSLVQKGEQRLKDFTWQNTARQLITIFEASVNVKNSHGIQSHV